MFSRKTFIRQSGLAGAGLALSAARFANNMLNEIPLQKPDSGNPVTDEEFWNMIRMYFPRTGDFINLENGYFSPQASSTLYFHQRREEYINSSSSWYMRNEQTDAVEKVRKDLAQFLDVDSEELAITRNTTESLNIVICGFPWKSGDEVIIGDQDYGSMTEAFLQVAKRHKILVKIAKVPLIPVNDDEVAQAYLKLVTPSTKMVHLTHVINLTGQCIPVAHIAEKFRIKGIRVLVDAAHSVAQLNYKIPDLKADYVGASLHKWLCCPLGNGMLWMKKELIPEIWPLLAPEGQKDDNIRKFQQQGTRAVQSVEAISKAIAFHNVLGSEIKQNRLKYLMNRWVSQVVHLPKVKILTPWDQDNRNSAIASFAIEGMSPGEIADKLFRDFKIYTVAINHPVIKGVRVTPHLYNSPREMDALAGAIKKIAASI